MFRLCKCRFAAVFGVNYLSLPVEDFLDLVSVEKLQPYENREKTHQDDVFTETEEETVLKSHGKTTAGNTTVCSDNLTNQCAISKIDRFESGKDDPDVFEDTENQIVNGAGASESKKVRRLHLSSSLPETDLKSESGGDISNHQMTTSVKPRRRSASSVSDEKQSSERWTKPKSTASSSQNNDSTSSRNMSTKPGVLPQSNGHSGELIKI